MQMNAEKESNHIAVELERSRYDGMVLTQEERTGKLRADLEAKKEAQRIREKLIEGNTYDNPDPDVPVAIPIGGPEKGEGWGKSVTTTATEPKPSPSQLQPTGYHVQEYSVSNYDIKEYKSVYEN